MYSLNPEDGSIAETLVKTLLNSIDCRIFKLTQFVCSAVEGSFFFKISTPKIFGGHWSLHKTLGCRLSTKLKF